MTAEFWMGEQFCTIANQDISKWLFIPPIKQTNLALSGDRFRKFVSEALGNVSDCNVAEG